jgi:aryl-alcohol dehydrogenase-like predicted oxidoreductase
LEVSTALTLPRISLGCGNFGGVGSAPAFFGRGLNQDQAFELMDAAWEQGIRHFDTADAYGGGRSERMVGAWIASRGVRPMLTTKTFNPMDEGADHGLAPERIERQLEQSFERLGLDQVDLYLAHEFDPDVPLTATFAAFDELREAGKIGSYGVSNFDAEQLIAALAVGRPEAVQNSYSLLERGDGEDGGVLPVCAERGVSYLVFSPLAGGWLTGKYRRGEAFPAGSRMTQRPQPYGHLIDDRTFDALESLEAVSAARGTSMAGTALAWLLADERIAQVVTGPGQPQHLAPIREALDQPLTNAERAGIEAVFA